LQTMSTLDTPRPPPCSDATLQNSRVSASVPPMNNRTSRMLSPNASWRSHPACALSASRHKKVRSHSAERPRAHAAVKEVPPSTAGGTVSCCKPISFPRFNRVSTFRLPESDVEAGKDRCANDSSTHPSSPASSFHSPILTANPEIAVYHNSRDGVEQELGRRFTCSHQRLIARKSGRACVHTRSESRRGFLKCHWRLQIPASLPGSLTDEPSRRSRTGRSRWRPTRESSRYQICLSNGRDESRTAVDLSRRFHARPPVGAGGVSDAIAGEPGDGVNADRRSRVRAFLSGGVSNYSV
jgi:hypothetical protein